MSYKQLLHNRFFIEDIGDTRYLVEKADGKISALNPTASILVDLFLADFDKNEAVESIATATNTSSLVIEPAVADFIQALETQHIQNAIPETYTPTLGKDSLATKVTAYYLINNTCIKVCYSNQQVFEENDKLLHTMRCDNTQNPEHTISVYETSRYTDIFIDGQGKIGTKDQAWVNGLLRSCLIELAYKNINNLMTLHAAGASHNGKAILFTGPSGSGKSTLSTYLCLQGYGYLGDDSIPIDLDNNKAHSMPTAVSLKKGSWNLFESLKPVIANAPLQRQFIKPMKTIEPPITAKQHNTASNIHALVFSKFDPTQSSRLKQLSLNQALPLIEYAETKFNPEKIEQTPLAMLRWLNSIPCYQMYYASLEEAEQLIQTLLTHHSL